MATSIPYERSIDYKRPWLMAEWNYVLNPDPATVGASSEKQVTWTCIYCGNSWTSRARSHKKLGCRECNMKIARRNLMLAKPGESLADLHPDIAAEWDFDDERSFNPKIIKHGSNLSVHWKCSKDPEHKWVETVAARALQGHGCPFCANEIRSIKRSTPKPGESLADVHPDVAKYWDNELNKPLTAYDVKPYSNKTFHWHCDECGATWENSANMQVKRHNQCTGCANVKHASFPEKAMYFYLKQAFPDALENHSPEIPGFERFELDVWIPSISTGFEYDGEYWHGMNPDKDLRKDKACEKAGIRLIRIRESGCVNYGGTYPTVISRDLSQKYSGLDLSITAAIKAVTDDDIDVDCERDRLRILEIMRLNALDNSIATTHPHLLDEWDYERNIGITPQMFTPGSGVEVYWICPNGHIYSSVIHARTAGCGCDTCARINNGKHLAIPTPGNTLADIRPDLVKEWDKDRNGDLTPYDVSIYSNIKVWWKCSNPDCGHVWLAEVCRRTSGKKSGCRKCRYKKSALQQTRPAKGKSLADVQPILAEFMLPEDNNGLTAYDVTKTSKIVHTWTCPNCKEKFDLSCGLMYLRKTKCQKCGYGSAE